MTKTVETHLNFEPTPEQINSLPEHMDYALKIYNKKIPSCQIAYQAIQRCIYEHIHADKIFNGRWKFYSDPGRQFVKFFESVPVYEGPRSGIDFHKMMDWQKFLWCEVEGWRSAEDPMEHRFNEVIFEVGKGSGKTSMLGIRMLYALLYGYENAEYYSIATSELQSKDPWKHTRKAANAMRDTHAKDIEPTATVLTNTRTGAFYKFLSGSPNSLDGKNCALLHLEEVAKITNREVVDKIKLGQGKQDSAITYMTTHPQYDTSTYYYNTRQGYAECLKGAIPMNPMMERTFMMVYQLDDKSEIEDQNLWLKAQPGLGTVPSLEWMVSEYERRKRSRRDMRAMEVYNFGIWQRNETSWIDVETWDACHIDPDGLGIELDFSGENTLATDLARRRDLACVSQTCQHGKEWHNRWKYWTNMEVYRNLKPDVQAYYDEAVKDGILTICPGDSIDFEPIIDHIKKLCKEHDVRLVAVDPHMAYAVTTELEESGIKTFDVNQGFAKLADATDTVEAKIYDKEIKHEGDQFTRWQLQNCEVHQMSDEKKAIIKHHQSSQEKVDGIKTLITAARAMVEPKEPKKKLRIRSIPRNVKPKVDDDGKRVPFRRSDRRKNAQK